MDSTLFAIFCYIMFLEEFVAALFPSKWEKFYCIFMYIQFFVNHILSEFHRCYSSESKAGCFYLLGMISGLARILSDAESEQHCLYL